MTTLTILIQNRTGGIRVIRHEKEIKGIQVGKKEVKYYYCRQKKFGIQKTSNIQQKTYWE